MHRPGTPCHTRRRLGPVPDPRALGSRFRSAGCTGARREGMESIVPQGMAERRRTSREAAEPARSAGLVFKGTQLLWPHELVRFGGFRACAFPERGIRQQPRQTGVVNRRIVAAPSVKLLLHGRTFSHQGIRADCLVCSGVRPGASPGADFYIPRTRGQNIESHRLGNRRPQCIFARSGWLAEISTDNNLRVRDARGIVAIRSAPARACCLPGRSGTLAAVCRSGSPPRHGARRTKHPGCRRRRAATREAPRGRRRQAGSLFEPVVRMRPKDREE